LCIISLQQFQGAKPIFSNGRNLVSFENSDNLGKNSKSHGNKEAYQEIRGFMRELRSKAIVFSKLRLFLSAEKCPNV
jgi:hypothetical protein